MAVSGGGSVDGSGYSGLVDTLEPAESGMYLCPVSGSNEGGVGRMGRVTVVYDKAPRRESIELTNFCVGSLGGRCLTFGVH